MIFSETKLKGAYVIDIEPHKDHRGFFARTWCKNEFEIKSLNSDLVQCNLSYNINKGTIRGMHYQSAPYEEAKLVRCIKGSVYDVIIDLRPKSATFLQWIGVELTQKNYKMLYVPEGFAHGFQTLENNTEVFYQVSQNYSPDYEKGVRWDDPTFGIEWPIMDKLIISDKDKNFGRFIHV